MIIGVTAMITQTLEREKYFVYFVSIETNKCIS